MVESKVRTRPATSAYTILVLNTYHSEGFDWGKKFKTLIQESGESLCLVNSNLNDFVLNDSQTSSMVILNIQNSSDEYPIAIANLCKYGFRGPVVLPMSTIEQWRDSKQILESCDLQKELITIPCMIQDVMGLVRRTLCIDQHVARNHVRIQLNRVGKVRIVNDEVTCTVRDISKGGAGITFAEKSNLRAGEMVALSVEITGSTAQKEISFDTQNIRARVAWANPHRKTVGLEFILD